MFHPQNNVSLQREIPVAGGVLTETGEMSAIMQCLFGGGKVEPQGLQETEHPLLGSCPKKILIKT